MKKGEIEEALKAIDTLNDEIQLKLGDDADTYHNLAFISNGYYHFITFMEIELWRSEDDQRKRDNNDVPELFEIYLRRRMEKELQILNRWLQ